MIVAYFLTIFNHFLNISFLCLSFPLEKLRITIEKFIRDNNFCVDVIPASGIFIYFLFNQATRRRLTPIFLSDLSRGKGWRRKKICEDRMEPRQKFPTFCRVIY